MALPEQINTSGQANFTCGFYSPASGADNHTSRIGPYANGTDIYIVVLHVSGNANLCKVIKSTDPGTSAWAKQDDSNSPAAPATLGAPNHDHEGHIDSTFDGQYIHIVQTLQNFGDNFAIHYHKFNTSNDTWTTTNEVVFELTGMADYPDTPQNIVQIHYRPNTANELVVVGVTGANVVMNTAYEYTGAFHKDKDATTWTGPVGPGITDSVTEWSANIFGSSLNHNADVINCYGVGYNAGGNKNCTRSFLANNTWGTERNPAGTGLTTSFHTRAISFNRSSGNDAMAFSFAGIQSDECIVYRTDTNTSTGDFVNNIVQGTTVQGSMTFANNAHITQDTTNDRVYVSMRNNTSLRVEYSDNLTGWTLLDSDVFGSNLNYNTSGLAMNVFNRSGGIYLGYVGYNQPNNEVWYDEYEIQAATSSGIEYFYSGWDIKRLMDRMIKVPGR